MLLLSATATIHHSLFHKPPAPLHQPPISVHRVFPPPKPKPSTPVWNPRSQSPLHHVSLPDPSSDEALSPPSVAAVAAAIRRASPSSPVEFTRRVEKQARSGLAYPSADFHRLCVEQLDLFRMIVHRDAVLSVYVRPAGSYVMNQLELRQVTFFPGIDMSDSADYVILVGNFAVPAGLHAAEAALSKQQVEFVPECGAVVLPMVKHPFVVGFLVAELPNMEVETCEHAQNDEQHLPFGRLKYKPDRLPLCLDRTQEIRAFKDDFNRSYGQLTATQRSRAIIISRSLAVAYVMDQKAMLLQQSSWQNNIRMSHLVEQIHGSLSSIKALSKILSVHVKRSEISYDIIEDILVQSEHIKDALRQLQDAVYLTKANIVQYNENTMKRMRDGACDQPEALKSLLFESHSIEPESYSAQKLDSIFSPSSGRKDSVMPMPPLLLAPLQQHKIRPCNASNVLKDLVGAAVPLANKQRRFLQLNEVSHPLHVAVEESALQQALSNLIEGALLRTQIDGKVEIYAAAVPAGGALIVIDDNGPDMHYMTQMHSLTPFGADLFSHGDGRVEDNMTWNFVAGLAVAREILENFGCVVRVVSPRNPDASQGAGGTRIELWLPSVQPDSGDTGLEA